MESFGIFGGAAPATLIKPVSSLPQRMRYYDGQYPEKIPTGYPWNGGNFVLVDKQTEISPGIFLVFTISKTPGTLELRELSLVLRGPEGLSVIVGCSHPGIEEILQAASAIGPHVHFLCGGLHLVSTPETEIDRLVDNLKNKWKLEKVAPGHCCVCKKPLAMTIFTREQARGSKSPRKSKYPDRRRSVAMFSLRFRFRSPISTPSDG